jgi:hypothetical protein
MTLQNLLIDLVKSRNGEGVEIVLDDYARAQGLASHLDLPTRFLGGSEGNASGVEAMGYSGNAAFEKITNMHDAVTTLQARKGWFQTDPKTPRDAMEEVAARIKEDGVPRVHVAIAHAAPGSGRGAKKKVEANVSFIDEGVGIAPEDMHGTILSMRASNKLRNPLMMGCYGQGGSAIHNFAHFTLVVSRSVDHPDVLGFTIVYNRHFPQTTARSYIYITNPDGTMPTVRVEDIRSSVIATSAEMRKAQDDDLVVMIRDRLILPEHGTIIKTWNLRNSPFTSRDAAYNFLRDRGFSMPSPTHLADGVAGGHGRRHLEVRGHRDILSDDPKVKGSDHYLSLADRPASKEVLDNAADIRCWIRDRKEVDLEKRRSVVEGITGLSERVGESIYVTLNGMTHFNMRTQVILRNVGLEVLAPYFFMEIDCDGLDYVTKGDLFTSNRESMKKEYQEQLRADIETWLANEVKDPASSISIAYHTIMDRILASRSASAASQRHTEAFVRIMKSSVVGNILSLFGRSGSIAGGRTRDGDVKGSGEGAGDAPSPRESGTNEPPERPINEIPTMLSINKSTIQTGRAEYVHAITDAPDEWTDQLAIELPDFMTLLNEPDLDNGRISYRIEAEAPAGTTGRVTVTLDRSRIGMKPLTASAEVTVVVRKPAERSEKNRSPKVQRGIPSIEFVETAPGDDNWVSIADSAIEDDRLAMGYLTTQSSMTVFWNSEFRPVVDAAAEVRIRVSDTAAATLLERTKMHAQLLAMMHRESGSENSSESKARWSDSIAACAVQNMTDLIPDPRKPMLVGEPGLFD